MRAGEGARMEGESLSDWLSGLSVTTIGIGILALMLVSAAAGDLIRKLQQRRSGKLEREPGDVRGTMRRITAALASVSVVSGCVQGPNYVKPTVEVPGAYRFAGAVIQPDAET